MDGSGKSTVAGIIEGHLRSEGRDVTVVTHPNRDTAVGRLELKALTRDGKPALMVSTVLYIADVLMSLWRTRKVRRRGGDLVFVRYTMAVAYLPDTLCGTAYRVIRAVLPKPDVMVLVDADPDEAMDRILRRGEELETFESSERLARVRGRMLSLSDGWIVLRNGGDVRELERSVRSSVFGEGDARPHPPVRGRAVPGLGEAGPRDLRGDPCPVRVGRAVRPAQRDFRRPQGHGPVHGGDHGDGDRRPHRGGGILLQGLREHGR